MTSSLDAFVWKSSFVNLIAVQSHSLTQLDNQRMATKRTQNKNIIK